MNTELDIDYDEETGLWCVFREEKAIGTFFSQEEAEDWIESTYGLNPIGR